MSDWIVGQVKIEHWDGRLVFVEQGALFDTDALTIEEAQECNLHERTDLACSA